MENIADTKYGDSIDKIFNSEVNKDYIHNMIKKGFYIKIVKDIFQILFYLLLILSLLKFLSL